MQKVFDKKYTTDLDECQAQLRSVNDKIREIRINTKSIQEFEEREKQIALMKEELEQLKWASEG